MSKTLIVVESPKKAKEVQKYLGKDYIVRASMGHVVDLISTPRNRLGVDVENGFKPFYAVIPEKKDKLAAIIDAASLVDQIYLASDPDREGEAIAWHISDHLKGKKPIRRVLFQEITKAGVKAGLDKVQDLDKNLFDAQQARRVLDRLVGFMVSPFLMDVMGGSLSAGRVQSVTLRLIVDREREIENFKPDEYWSISAALAKPETLDDKFVARYHGKVTNKADATKIKSDLDNDTYDIIEVVAEEKAKSPFPPFTTAKLQQAASRKYKLSADRTMKAAQSLYESGIVSYIRTDSVRSSPESIASVRDWLLDNGHQVPSKPNHYAVKSNAQDAHEAIRPTDVETLPSEKSNLSEDERKVYQLVWERFVASQMKPALYDTLAVTIRSSSGHVLKATGRTLKFKGWLEIMDFKDKEDDDQGKLPNLKKGDVVILVPPKVKAEQKFTQPPPRYKIHSLVEELEKRGIARPSTYAAIITKVTDRQYVEKKADTFYATELGKKVVDLLIQFFDFMQYQYTAEMETQLDQIAEGKLDYLGMLGSFFPKFKDQLRKADSMNEKNYGINCWICSKTMKLKHGKFGYYMSCSDYPNCKTTRSCEIVNDKPVFKESGSTAPVVDGVSCPKCSSTMTIRDGKFGKFYSCTKYPKCNGSAKVPSGHKCDKCGYDMYITVFDGVSKLACMGYPHCRNIVELPEGTPLNWIDPKTIQSKKKNKAVEKILNPSRKVP